MVPLVLFKDSCSLQLLQRSDSLKVLFRVLFQQLLLFRDLLHHLELLLLDLLDVALFLLLLAGVVFGLGSVVHR